ncbi:MAG: DEAD/DEAH box helicase, partial [Chloroflexota bacterium]
MTVETMLAQWRSEATIGGNITAWETIPGRSAKFIPFPNNIHPVLLDALESSGIQALYSHQYQTWQEIKNGHHVAIATSTASGKSLAYNLPIFDQLLHSPNDRALLLFPTKALAQDQLSNINNILMSIAGNTNIVASIYDGDTQRNNRSAIRKNSRMLLSNPDMLHLGVLPHHTAWIDFFQNLRFVVLDEMHNYRGVFGSHIANVLRRLKRIANHYGTQPQFILTSATINNPGELASTLIEAPVKCISQDGSARGPKHFLIYNPPIINPELGLRASALRESVRIAHDLINHGLQTIIFGRSRRSVESMLKTLRELFPVNARQSVRAYRSGYLSQHRRGIEQSLRENKVNAVIATSALELGIDIGGLNASILASYPGTISGAWQQAGRSGRGAETSLAVLVASSNPLDQFFAHNPDYFFLQTPEQALINPDNLLILLQHIQCAAFEIPFKENEPFGNLDSAQMLDLLSMLCIAGFLHKSGNSFYWMSDQYPAAQISLRSTSSTAITLQSLINNKQKTIGVIDEKSAPWMVHPGAIYLHEGNSYQVETLDFEHKIAILNPAEVDYYTIPQQETEVRILDLKDQLPTAGGSKAYGEIAVTSLVSGFKKIRWETQERLGVEKLEPHATVLHTTGYWLTLSAETIQALQASNLWKNEPNQYGPSWKEIADFVRNRDQYLCKV